MSGSFSLEMKSFTQASIYLLEKFYCRYFFSKIVINEPICTFAIKNLHPFWCQNEKLASLYWHSKLLSTTRIKAR